MKGKKGVVLGVLLAIFLTGAFAQAAEPIKIGAILSVTGPASFLGEPEARTLEMLVAETNKKGGVMGRQVQLIIKDSGASPEKAFSFAKQLIEEEKVFAIIGPSTSGETMKIKAANVQAIVNWSIEPAQAIVIKNARQIGLTIPIFQSHGFGNIKYVQAAGAAAEGVLFPAGRLLVADVLPKNHPQKALLLQYTKDYESKYKDEASTFGGHAYDAYIILLKAIEQAKSTDTEAVRTAIENLKGVVGTGGIFNFSATDHNGLGVDAFEMLTVKKGKFATQ